MQAAARCVFPMDARGVHMRDIGTSGLRPIRSVECAGKEASVASDRCFPAPVLDFPGRTCYNKPSCIPAGAAGARRKRAALPGGRSEGKPE